MAWLADIDIRRIDLTGRTARIWRSPSGVSTVYIPRMRIYWICAVVVAFVLGIAAEKAVEGHSFPPVIVTAQNSVLAGIEQLHQLDVRVTLLNDPKALQQEWSDVAVRLEPDSPVDVGKAAIYASDMRSLAEAPGSAIVFKPDIRDIRVINSDWAVEWGLFDAGFRESAGRPVQTIRGKVLRVLHREKNGDWKFSRVMVVWNQKH